MLEKTVIERFEKYKQIEEKEVICDKYLCDDADIVVVAYGITARVARSAVKMARENGIKAGLFRCVTLYPFPNKELKETAETASKFLSVEMNMGQMVNDIKVAIDCKVPVEHFGRTGGMVPTVDEIYEQIVRMSK